MKIKISIDSYANIHSRHERIVDLVELDFDSVEAWEAASEDERYQAVLGYWHENGIPEVCFEVAEDE